VSWPNPRLQRTRAARSPLSRQPLHRLRRAVSWATLMLGIPLVVGAQAASKPNRPLNPNFPSQVTSVTLERKGCYGTCPVYSVKFRSDDGASWTGIAHVDRMGTYIGTTSFQKLGLWIESQPTLMSGSEQLKVAVDGETVVLTIRLRDGATIVKHFGTGSERKDLWAAAEVIDGVASKVRWQKAPVK
jgi:Domain of unknown function (DUF6438)